MDPYLPHWSRPYTHCTFILYTLGRGDIFFPHRIHKSLVLSFIIYSIYSWTSSVDKCVRVVYVSRLLAGWASKMEASATHQQRSIQMIYTYYSVHRFSPEFSRLRAMMRANVLLARQLCSLSGRYDLSPLRPWPAKFRTETVALVLNREYQFLEGHMQSDEVRS